MPDLTPRTDTPKFILDIPMRWGDMDAMGHINNTIYFRYMEQARISWFDLIGIPPNPKGEGPVIVNARCDFLKELRYPGIVRVKTFLGELGRSSFDTLVEMSPLEQPDLVYARGGAKIVWVNFPQGRSATLPANILAQIQIAHDTVFQQ